MSATPQAHLSTADIPQAVHIGLLQLFTALLQRVIASGNNAALAELQCELNGLGAAVLVAKTLEASEGPVTEVSPMAKGVNA